MGGISEGGRTGVSTKYSRKYAEDIHDITGKNEEKGKRKKEREQTMENATFQANMDKTSRR